MASSSKKPKLTIEISTDLTVDETLFDHLPDEVQLKIFKLLEIEDVMHCSQVSTRLKVFLRGWLLVLGLEEGLVECATLCVKS